MAASPGRPLSGTRDVMPRGSDADESGDDPAEAEAREQLERRNKALDSARRGYMEESNRIISKQQDAIERLKEENRRLKSELDAGTKAETTPPSATEYARLAQLKDLVESYSRKLDIEQRKVEDQNKDIEVAETKALNLRKIVGGANGARDNTAQTDRMRSVMENRLEKAQVKYNQLLSQNTRQRDEIDHLRKERIMFENIYKKLEIELHDRKAELASRIELSNVAYEARDQALAEMAAIRAQGDGEQTAFEIEMARLNARLGARSRTRDAAMRELLYSSVQSISHLKEDGAAAEAALDSYEDAFERLRGVLGGDAAPGDVVSFFLNKEDANLTLFNYVRELKEELEKLSELKSSKEAELERVKKQGELHCEGGQRKEMMEELEAELQRHTERAEAIRLKNEETVRAMEQMAKTARDVARRVGADASSITEEILSSGGPVDAVNAWLGVLEERANESVAMWSAYQAVHAAHGQQKIAGPKAAIPGPTAKLSVTAPTIDASDSDSSSDDDMPLTRDQLKTKVAHKTGIAYEKFIGASPEEDKPLTRQRPASALPPGEGSPSQAHRRVSSARAGPLAGSPGKTASAKGPAVKGDGGDRKVYTPGSTASAAGDAAAKRTSSASSRRSATPIWKK